MKTLDRYIVRSFLTTAFLFFVVLMLLRVVADLSAREAVRDTVGQSLRAITLSTFEAVLWVFQFLLFFVVTIYLLIDLDRVRDRAKDMVPLKHKDDILRITRQIDVNLKAFFRGQIVVVLALSAIFTVGLAIVQCPFWYIIGVAGGLGAFTPPWTGPVGFCLTAACCIRCWRRRCSGSGWPSTTPSSRPR